MQSKKIVIGVCTVAAVLALCAIPLGCAPKSSTAGNAESSAGSDATQAASLDMNLSDSYAEMFPLEYNSAHETWVDDKGITKGHSTFRDIIEGPLMRDRNGAIMRDEDGNYLIAGYTYDTETGQYVIDQLDDETLASYGLYSGCIACKSSKFNDLYDEMGASAFSTVMNQDVKDTVNGDYWDCAGCHDGTPSSDNVGANYLYFNALGEGLIEDLSAGELACGQCHNSYDYRRYITTEDALSTYKAYRYGYDIDGLLQANLEDKCNVTTDEETGITTANVLHADIEMYQESVHQAQGLSCTDCHMPQSTDPETGKTYTNHNASGSPLDNEDSLNFCLTCHESQGIASTDAMVSFVKEKQAETAAKQADVEQKEAAFFNALKTAIVNNSKDAATLEQAKALYTKVTWYVSFQQGGLDMPGDKVAMSDSSNILAQASAMCDEGMALLA